MAEGSASAIWDFDRFSFSCGIYSRLMLSHCIFNRMSVSKPA